VNDGIRALLGVDLDIASVPWTTAHCDLHWGNLTAPTLTILDWETWGRAPAGYDAATLLCTSLGFPGLTRRVSRGGELTELALPIRQYAMEALKHL
jgi:hypothetical protein